jgi:hypothetical protein
MTLVVFQKGRICVRLLIISALAVTLTGCAYFAPQQARQASLTSERVWTVAKTLQRPSQRRTVDTAGRLNTHTKNAKSNIVPASLSSQSDDKSNVVISAKPNIVRKTETPQSSQPDDRSNVVISAKPNIVTKMEAPQSSQPDDKFDPVITKAMTTIAETMGLENTASVELSKVKRAKKNALGKSIDTICGYVRLKNTSGAGTGGRAFLYLVQEDEAYIDGYNLATSLYRNLCTQTASGLLEFLL